MLGIRKQAYYKRKGDSTARKAVKEAFALEYIHKIREQAPGIGGVKIRYMYRRDFPDKDLVGRDRFEDIINNHGLKVRAKRRKVRTTDSSHGLPVFPNLAYDFIPTAINQLWVSDITYIPVWLNEEEYTFCYLALIMDAYSHEIIGWAVGATLETLHACEALKMAFSRLNAVDEEIVKRLIHHSDRGVQYASKDYVGLMQGRGIRISMTERGNPKDNALAERINSTMKNELLKGLRFTCIKEVRDAIAAAVEFYNTARPHMSVDMMTPEEAAKWNGEIHKWWRSYREEAIKRELSDANP